MPDNGTSRREPGKYAALIARLSISCFNRQRNRTTNPVGFRLLAYGLRYYSYGISEEFLLIKQTFNQIIYWL